MTRWLYTDDGNYDEDDNPDNNDDNEDNDVNDVVENDDNDGNDDEDGDIARIWDKLELLEIYFCRCIVRWDCMAVDTHSCIPKIWPG